MSVVRTLIGNVKGPKGDTGATGATGAQGDAATIQVGTVTTGAYGTNASVTNSGTEQDAVFDFVIPQGKPGEEVTDASNLTLNEITASSANYPTFTVQERLKGIFGKIQKFLSDLKNNYVSKSMMTISTDVDTAGQAVADAKAIKSLNDRLANYVPYYVREITINKSYTFAAYEAKNLSVDLDPLIPYNGYTVIQPLGGKGNGGVGLMINCGTVWAFNASNTSRTFNSVTFYMLYRKNI